MKGFNPKFIGVTHMYWNRLAYCISLRKARITDFWPFSKIFGKWVKTSRNVHLCCISHSECTIDMVWFLKGQGHLPPKIVG